MGLCAVNCLLKLKEKFLKNRSNDVQEIDTDLRKDVVREATRDAWYRYSGEEVEGDLSKILRDIPEGLKRYHFLYLSIDKA